MRIVLNKKVGTGLKNDFDSGWDRQVSVNDTLPRKLFELCPKKDDVNILNLNLFFKLLYLKLNLFSSIIYYICLSILTN